MADTRSSSRARITCEEEKRALWGNLRMALSTYCLAGRLVDRPSGHGHPVPYFNKFVVLDRSVSPVLLVLNSVFINGFHDAIEFHFQSFSYVLLLISTPGQHTMMCVKRATCLQDPNFSMFDATK